jgi:methionyl aminopeptidase
MTPTAHVRCGKVVSFLGWKSGRDGEPPPRALHEESRKLGKLLGEIFAKIEPALVPGTTTKAIDTAVEARISALGVSSSYRMLKFPGCCTTSIDSEVINVPPSPRRLEIGQLLKLQIGIKGERTYATQAWTYAIGACDEEARRLMAAGLDALRLAVAAVRTGTRVGVVSAAIQARIEAAGFSVNRHFIGHGIDTRNHADPQIPCFGNPEFGRRMRDGAILSLNVIAHAGKSDCEVKDDEWTAIAKDGRRSVHFGQMVIAADAAEEVTAARPA